MRATPPLLLLLLPLLSSTVSADIVVPDDWIEYTPGTCRLLISAPHGGNKRVSEIAERTNGCLDSQDNCQWVKGCSNPSSTKCKAKTYADSYTGQIAAAVVAELSSAYGCTPHFVRANIHRSRLDANRDIDEAAQGDPLAEAAWHRYHTEYMSSAVASIAAAFGKGLVIDIHGQTHSEQWTEIGTLLSKYDLNNDRFRDLAYTSIKGLKARSNQTCEDLVRGSTSLGGFLSAEGYKVVPSPAYPSPGDGGYFSGGFTVKTYGSMNGGSVDGLQVEVNSNIRSSSTERGPYSAALAKAIWEFLQKHYY